MQKKLFLPGRKLKDIIKLLFIMKFVLLILIMSSLQAYSKAFSQEKFSLSLQNVKIKKVLSAIEHTSNYRFIYTDNIIPGDERVNISAKNATLSQMLDSLFAHTKLVYKIFDNGLVAIGITAQKVAPIHLSGEVTDSTTGQPLVGVTIQIKGTKLGTITNASGNFSIEAPENAVLEISYLGYNNKEISLSGQSSVTIKLSPNTTGLNQLVVIGYGTTRKANLTGAVSTVNGSELKKSPVANLSNTLAGAVPGLIVNSRSGEPGNDDATIFIRGKGTFGSNAPLIVIDGIPDPPGGMDRLNPSNIESISVIKDATAAIYGARAANGVILITTKRGIAGKPQLTFNTNVSVTQPTRVPQMLNSWQYAESVNEYDQLVGQQPTYTNEEIGKYKDGSDPLGYPNTNWWNVVMNKWSSQTNNILSLQGGSEKVRYYLSGEALRQNSMYKGGSDYYTNKNARVNLDINATDNFKISVDALYRHEYRLTEDPSYSSEGSIFSELWNAYPYLVARYPNGKVGVGIGGGPDNSMVYILNGDKGFTKNNYDFLLTKTTLHWDLSKITKGLTLSAYYSYNLSLYDYKGFNKIPPPAYSYSSLTGSYTEVKSSIPPDLSLVNQKTIDQLTNVKLGYNRQFGLNKLNIFIAYEQSQETYTELDGFRNGFLSNNVAELFAGSSIGATNNSTTSQTARQDYISRLSYSYADKYLLDFNMRYDGSSNFPPEKRFGFFPAVSAAWRISQEKFFNSSIVDELKLRASWGQTGNDAVSPFQYIQTYNIVSGQQSQYLGAGYFYGPNAIQAPALTLGPTPNLNITWEVATKTDIGIDAELFKQALNITIDAFRSMRSHILIPPTAIVPEYTGIILPDENLGKVLNHGIEINIGYQGSIDHSFSYRLNGNATFAINKVIYEGEPSSVPAYQRMTGHPIDSWLLYQAEGLFQDSSQVNKYPHPLGSGPGDIRYKDVNGDGVINALDEIRSTESETPQIMFGANLEANYKNFDITIFLQGQARAKAILMPDGLNMAEQFFTGRWLKEGDNKYPRTFNGPTSRTYGSNTYSSTFWLLNDAFLRLKNVEIGYTIPERLLNKIKVKSVRIYLSGNNLFSIDDWGPSFDPESPSSTVTTGRYYPQLRVLNAGASITF